MYDRPIENHWVETTSFSYSAPQYTKLDQPVGQMQKIFDGLALRFVSRDSKTGKEIETTCPLNLFNRQGDGQSLTVRLENRAGCKIFSEDATVKPMLYLVNQISFPVRYKKGTEVRDWSGRILQAAEEATYYPEVRFAGRVAILGYSFATSESSGRTLK